MIVINKVIKILYFHYIFWNIFYSGPQVDLEYWKSSECGHKRYYSCHWLFLKSLLLFWICKMRNWSKVPHLLCPFPELELPFGTSSQSEQTKHIYPGFLGQWKLESKGRSRGRKKTTKQMNEERNKIEWLRFSIFCGSWEKDCINTTNQLGPQGTSLGEECNAFLAAKTWYCWVPLPGCSDVQHLRRGASETKWALTSDSQCKSELI